MHIRELLVDGNLEKGERQQKIETNEEKKMIKKLSCEHNRRKRNKEADKQSRELIVRDGISGIRIYHPDRSVFVFY